MIYVVSLAVMARKALGVKNVFQAPPKVIIEQLFLDPKTTTMSAVLLGPADMAGVSGTKLREVIAKGIHPDICLMYIYQKESEAKDVHIPYMKGVRKINVNEIKSFVDASMNDFTSKNGSLDPNVEELLASTESDDAEAIKALQESTSEIPQDTTSFIPVEKPPEKEIVPEINFEKPVESKPMQFVPESDNGTTSAVDVPQPSVPYTPIGTREEMLQNIKTYEDMGLLQEAMKKDAITKRLIEESSEYAGALQMLDVLNNKIRAVYMDPALTSTAKFDKIREIGFEKSKLQASANSVFVQKVIDIINTVTTCAKRVVTDKVDSINGALAKCTYYTDQMFNDTELAQAISARTDLQVELTNISYDLVALYNKMDGLVEESAKSLDDGLPSNNAFINNMLQATDTHVFTPANTGQLIKALCESLQNNRIPLSALEDKINEVIRMIFQMFETDEAIIRHQQEAYDMLKAQHVEEVVVRDTLLKYVLRVYVGDDDTGRTATALTWSGVQSRTYNVLCIDITGTPHFDRYATEAITLHDFMTTRIEKRLLCVYAERKLDISEALELISEMRTRLNYYGIINVIAKPDDMHLLQTLSEEALSFNYITDCRQHSIDSIKECVQNTNFKNLAKKIIIIDPPMNPLQIAEALGADFTQVKIIALPNMAEIKKCAIKHDRPYEYTDVAAIFEEAFK